MTRSSKTMNLSIPGEIREWVSFAAARYETSMAGYIVQAVRRDMEQSPADVKAAFEAFRATLPSATAEDAAE